MLRPTAFSLTSLLLTSASLCAQWSTAPGVNLPIGDRTGGQDQGKIVTTSDGGCYVGWFDPSTGPYEVWLQRLDAAGVEQWPHGGVKISGNPQNSSLTDWDMIVDSEDHCVLTFTDIRVGPDLDVYAYRIAPNATFDWGANGVALSNNGEADNVPRVCETSDGGFGFTWSHGTTNTIQFQRVTRAGVPVFPGDGVAILPDAGALPGFSRIVAADAGSVILTWVRTISFSGNKHIHAQKFDALGSPLWGGGTRIAVFDGGSVPIAYEPKVISDRAGGAFVYWHWTPASIYSSRVQHLLANGTEVFAHNGVDVSTNTTEGRFDPALALVPGTQDVVVAWNQRNAGQSSWGIYANKLDATGARLWGATGTVLLPINTVVKFAPVIAAFQGGAVVSVLEESLGNLADKVLTLRVDAAGALAWPAPVEACNVASDKLRLVGTISPSGVAMLSWTDKRVDFGDVIVQNVNPDGTLGAKLGAAPLGGCGTNPAGSFAVVGRPALGATVQLAVDNPLATQASGSVSLFVLAAQADAAWPCGTKLTGFGMAGSGAQGELLVDLAGPYLAVAGPTWTGTGNPARLPLGVPLDLSLVGRFLYVQGALLDFSATTSAPIGLANGAKLTLGY